MTTAILWKRLDVEGHDACRLMPGPVGWKLSGRAVFDHQGLPCGLSYDVDCDGNWRTHSASVAGWIGEQDLRFDIRRGESGQWLLNGIEQPHVEYLVDVDLGFTPATNLLALNRYSLAIGEKTEAPAAYLSFPELRMERLEQTYERIGEGRYAYSAPLYRYEEVLEVSETGFVTNYPKLWHGKLWRSEPVEPH